MLIDVHGASLVCLSSQQLRTRDCKVCRKMSSWKFRLHRMFSHSWFMVPCWKNVQLNLYAKTDPVIEASTGHVFRNYNGAMKGLAEVGISCTFSLNTFVFALTRSTYILRLILIPSRGLPILLFIYLFAWSFSFLSLRISIQKKMFGIRWVIGVCFCVNFLWICSSINRNIFMENRA